MSAPDENEVLERPAREIGLDEELMQGMREDVTQEFGRSVKIKAIREDAEAVEMKVNQLNKGLRDILSLLHKENDERAKSLVYLNTVRKARQKAGEVFVMLSDLGVQVVEDEDLIRMRLQLQAEAAEQENRMKELEREMVEEEVKAYIRANRISYLTADINLRKQVCNEMEADSKRRDNEKAELSDVFRAFEMTKVDFTH